MPPKGSDLVFDHRHNAADRARERAQPCMFAEFAAALAAMTSPGDGGTAHSAMITVETDPAGAMPPQRMHVADTWEEVAKHRPAADAERLRAEAESARQYAAKEYGLSNQLSNDRGPRRRTPADEHGPSAAALGEDTKA